MSQTTLLLTKTQFVHVIDNNTGVIRLIEGPYRGSLAANEMIHGKIRNKVVLKANQYCVVLNPLSSEKKVLEGHHEVRKGPVIFSLHPSEIIEEGIQEAFSLAETQGIYIQNQETGEIKLELGPKEVFLTAEEVLYEKHLTDKELDALGLDETDEMAVRIELDENQIIQLVDDTSVRFELGPKTIFLRPFERPKVLTLSGDTPKRPDVITTAIIKLGPDFLSDILEVRTKDNAELKIHVRYKWRFNVDNADLSKIFSINDFIGFGSETIASMLRGIAANHDFEDFHSNAADIIKKVIFPDGDEKGLVFDNGFEIFSVDIKQITPVDPEIADKLQAAISHNMDVYVKKQQQHAEIDAKKQLINGEKIIEQQRKDLIALQSANYEKEVIEKMKIEAEAEIEKAKGLAQAELIKEEKRIQAEVDRVKELIGVLKDKPGNYLRYKELEAFGNVDHSIIIPEETKLWLPVDGKKRPENVRYEDYE
ncbi:MAG: SPFH domain-containing protein [Candidatus Odinarchaeota archaeon]